MFGLTSDSAKTNRVPIVSLKLAMLQSCNGFSAASSRYPKKVTWRVYKYIRKE